MWSRWMPRVLIHWCSKGVKRSWLIRRAGQMLSYSSAMPSPRVSPGSRSFLFICPSLQEVARLHALGFVVFLVGNERLVRIDGCFWEADFEFWWWANVVAFRGGPEGGRRVDWPAVVRHFEQIRSRDAP